MSLGRKDILLEGTKVCKISDTIDIDCKTLGIEIVDLTGKFLVPGFIDQHVHVIGAGGEGGYPTRTPEMQISNIVKYGITSIVCLRGTDGTARNLEALYAKATALEKEGITTYMLTGSFEVPVDTITGSVRRDVALIDKVIGVKTAISDRRSSQPTRAEVERLAAEAYTGGLVGGKRGYTHIHMGTGARRLNMVFDIIRETELPPYLFIPTHVNRDLALFDHAMELAKLGAYIDLTAGIEPGNGFPEALKTSKAIKKCIDNGVPLDQLTISSDSNGSMTVYDAQGNIERVVATTVDALYLELKDMIEIEGIPLETALKPLTENVAKAIGVYPQKGTIAEGADADLVILSDRLEIDRVYAKGKQVADKNGATIYGLFEHSANL